MNTNAQVIGGHDPHRLETSDLVKNYFAMKNALQTVLRMVFACNVNSVGFPHVPGFQCVPYGDNFLEYTSTYNAHGQMVRMIVNTMGTIQYVETKNV